MDAAHQTLRGESPNEYIGSALTALGDLDADGLEDFSVTNSVLPTASTSPDGVAAYLITDHTGGEFHPRDVGVTVRFDLTSFSNTVAVSGLGDVNLDGYRDVGIASNNFLANGRFDIIQGSAGGTTALTLSTDSSTALLALDGGPYAFLSFATSLGDWNGDGNGAIAVADAGFSTADAMSEHDCSKVSGCVQGAAYVLAAPIDVGTHDIGALADRVEGFFGESYLGGGYGLGGQLLAGDTDLNGDSEPDLVLSGGFADAHGSSSGVAYVLFGPGAL
jgi:hypothetical protein